MKPCTPNRIGIGSVGFYLGRNPEKNPGSKDENQQQTQPTDFAGSGNRTWDTLVEGERSHYCTIPAPLFGYSGYTIPHPTIVYYSGKILCKPLPDKVIVRFLILIKGIFRTSKEPFNCGPGWKSKILRRDIERDHDQK